MNEVKKVLPFKQPKPFLHASSVFTIFFRSKGQGGIDVNAYEETVSCRFAAFCVKVLKASAHKCYEEIRRRNEKEISLSLLCENTLDDLIIENKYAGAPYRFIVKDYLVEIHNDSLGEAIKQLDKSCRDILLLYYLLGFSNKEIAEICSCSLRTVIRRKKRALSFMREVLEE